MGSRKSLPLAELARLNGGNAVDVTVDEYQSYSDMRL